MRLEYKNADAVSATAQCGNDAACFAPHDGAVLAPVALAAGRTGQAT